MSCEYINEHFEFPVITHEGRDLYGYGRVVVDYSIYNDSIDMPLASQGCKIIREIVINGINLEAISIYDEHGNEVFTEDNIPGDILQECNQFFSNINDQDMADEIRGHIM
jgi:hypothetical protein